MKRPKQAQEFYLKTDSAIVDFIEDLQNQANQNLNYQIIPDVLRKQEKQKKSVYTEFPIIFDESDNTDLIR